MNASDKTKTPLPPKTVRRREKTLSQDQQHPWREKISPTQLSPARRHHFIFPPRLKYCKDMNLE